MRTYGSGPAAVHALDDVSLAVHRHELVALVGPSGSGKTTLLQMAGAIDRPTSGRVLHAGADLSTMKPAELTELRRREVGFVFQFFNLVPGLDAEDNVALVARLDGVSRSRARERARALLARIGLEHRRSHLPGQMSGGEQQRVAIARALMNRPRLLLADEPTGNLDQASGDGIIEMLTQVASEDGASVLIVTHDMRLLPRVQRVLMMRDGRLQPESQAEPVAG